MHGWSGEGEGRVWGASNGDQSKKLLSWSPGRRQHRSMASVEVSLFLELEGEEHGLCRCPTVAENIR